MTTSSSAPIPLTTAFTVPDSCATKWIEFGLNTIYRDQQHASLGAYGSDCWPPSYDHAKYSYYSPGVCPDQWTIATFTSVNSQSGQYVAHCCPTGYTFDSLCQSSIPPTTTRAYQYARITGKKNSTTTSFGLSPTTPIPYAIPTGGMAKIDGVPIKWASSDLSMLPSAPAAQLIAVMSPFASSTSSTSVSTTTVTVSAEAKGGHGLSVAAKAGIGAGAGVFGLLLIMGFIIYFLRIRKRKPVTKAASPVMELEGDSEFPNPHELPSKPPQIDWIEGEKSPRVLSGHFTIDDAGIKDKDEEDVN